MVETVKCSICGKLYEKGSNHECGERQKFAKDHLVGGDGGGHVDD